MSQPAVVDGNRPTRRGVTIVEFLIVVVVLGVVMGAVAMSFRKQQRFVTKTTSLLDVRSQMRQAASVLPAELRAMSSVGGDVYSMTPRTIDFRAATGGSMICRIPVVGSADMILPPSGQLRKGTLSWWLVPPQSGDSVFVYDEGAAVGNFDDSWRRYEITQVNPVNGAGGCLSTTGYIEVAEEALTSYRIKLSDNLPPTTPQGASVRFFRRALYRLHQAPDQQWYLSFAECMRVGGCTEFEPVSGPYRPFSATVGESGLHFTYLDSLGNVTALPAEVARVEIFLSGKTGRANDPLDAQESLDSLRLSVGVRNRS